MMKTAIALIFVVSGVTAFAPTATVGRTAVSTAAVADLDGMIGVDIETGKKIVSSMLEGKKQVVKCTSSLDSVMTLNFGTGSQWFNSIILNLPISATVRSCWFSRMGSR